MIYTTMDNLKSYYGISENLDKALDFLETCDLRTLAMGRNEVEGSQVFINRFNYETCIITDCRYCSRRSRNNGQCAEWSL